MHADRAGVVSISSPRAESTDLTIWRSIVDYVVATVATRYGVIR